MFIREADKVSISKAVKLVVLATSAKARSKSAEDSTGKEIAFMDTMAEETAPTNRIRLDCADFTAFDMLSVAFSSTCSHARAKFSADS